MNTAETANPLITAIRPLPQSVQELYASVKCIPQAPTPELRTQDKLQRIFQLGTLDHVFIPTARDMMAATTALRMLVNGYQSRPPTASYWGDHEKVCQRFASNHNRSSPSGVGAGQSAGLLGTSGSGKTTMIANLLSTIPQVIEHPSSTGSLLPRHQIVWLKVTCPSKGKPKAFIKAFFSEVDRLMGTDYADAYKHESNDDLVQHLGRIVRVYCVGLLVVDEIQEVVGCGDATDRELLRLFVKMTETLKVPHLYIGTPKSQLIIARELADARRMLGPTWCPFQRDDADWKTILRGLWKYQYTNVESPLTDCLEDTIYDLSQGLPALAKSLFQFAQQRVILNTRKGEREAITVQVLKDTAAEEMAQVAAPIQTLRDQKWSPLHVDLPIKEPGERAKERDDKLKAMTEGVFESAYVTATRRIARQLAVQNAAIT